MKTHSIHILRRVRSSKIGRNVTFNRPVLANRVQRRAERDKIRIGAKKNRNMRKSNRVRPKSSHSNSFSCVSKLRFSRITPSAMRWMLCVAASNDNRRYSIAQARTIAMERERPCLQCTRTRVPAATCFSMKAVQSRKCGKSCCSLERVDQHEME